METTNTALEMVTVECGRCHGARRFFFADGNTGECFGCDGRGTVRISAAKYAAAIAKAARTAQSYQDERANEQREQAAYAAAGYAIRTGGIEAARRFYAANRADRYSLMGLVAAMRDNGLATEANRLARTLA